MGRDPSSATLEVKIHPSRDDAAVHHGQGSSPPIPPRHSQRTSPAGSSSSSSNATSRNREDREFSLFRRWIPWLVPCFVVANVVLFIITMYVNDCPKHLFRGSCVASFLGRFSFQPLKENPLLGPSSYTLEKMGALVVDRVIHGEAWRLLSCMWLHGGVVHILANMLSLVFIGIRLEQEFGFVRIGFLYVISGFGGSLLSALFIQSGISVGASGALFGLLGGMLSEILINWTIYANKVAALLTLIVITLINLAVGILPHVDNFAHIGGFLSGFFLGFVFLIRPQFKWIVQRNSPSAPSSLKNRHKPYQYILWIISFLLLTSGYIIGLIFLLRGVNLNDHCSWCRYLSCVPTSLWRCDAKQVYCETSQIGNRLNITCLSNGRSELVDMPNVGFPSPLELCSQLCR
ncbi:RHOMBOID-like protein 1 [Arachis duranensis]|uniref:RHOMBOID-like protein n=1 Tax=Arachis duranensis TaxID=130453 RepID=A0A6P4BCP6_ARADU|nr:RHOMBOID-like protein 1 [Arachis duranensis]XP_025613909.1 RHOMBOID-like protein 1 isoform X1 [Arachis hypogaea]XP_025613910.1 RHOMBOID-like protein 1 isoform X1 [Arachis hypogaea]